MSSQIIGILFAGSETIANVLGVGVLQILDMPQSRNLTILVLYLQEFLYEMAHQPLIQQKLRQELTEFETQHGALPTFNDLLASGKDRLKYLDAVTMEVMRCKAVLMDIARMVKSRFRHSHQCTVI